MFSVCNQAEKSSHTGELNMHQRYFKLQHRRMCGLLTQVWVCM